MSLYSDGVAGMDVDDEATSLIFERAIRTETVFAKSQQLAVSFYSNLPVEVKQILKNSGKSLFQPPYSVILTFRPLFLLQTFTEIRTVEMLTH